MKSFGPKQWWERGLNEKCADDIIGGANCSFGFAILLRGIGTRKSKGDTLGSTERV